MNDEEKDYEVYDPYQADLQFLEGLGATEIEPDLANPQTVRFLTQFLIIRLMELKTQKKEINELRKKFDEIRDEREELRIELAKNQLSWIEIPASVFIGFSINILTEDKNNVLGILLLIGGLAIVILARFSQLSQIGKISIRRIKSNANNNGKNN